MRIIKIKSKRMFFFNKTVVLKDFGLRYAPRVGVAGSRVS